MKPYLIGIAGGSGSGKSTITKVWQDAFPNEITVIHFDDYYKDLSALSMEERAKINFDHPDAFDLDILEANIRDLKEGKVISKPAYDFTVHNRKPEWESLAPNRIMVIDGIFALAIDAIVDQLDLKVYVDVPADVRFIRRLERDMKERGRSFDSVKTQYLTTVRPMHDAFVEPSKQKADLIVVNTYGYQVAASAIRDAIRAELEK